jgi:hypothetical protein
VVDTQNTYLYLARFLMRRAGAPGSLSISTRRTDQGPELLASEDNEPTQDKRANSYESKSRALRELIKVDQYAVLGHGLFP